VNTHYAVIAFSGDPCGEHPDEELCGRPPSLTLLACGPEDFCWESLVKWTAKHPLRMWEDAEVVARHPSVVRAPATEGAPPESDSTPASVVLGPRPGHEVVHRCPPDGAALMPCCGKAPFDVPRYHRMTVDPELVTCADVD
jgi:hypothetical protein